MWRLAATGMLLALTMTACDEETGSVDGKDRLPEGERVPITARATAAIALEYLPTDTSSRRGADGDDLDSDQDGAVVHLRYGGEPGDDGSGDLVEVIVAEKSDHSDPCDDDGWSDGCAQLDSEDGTDLYLTWQEEEPEEDPGIVYVIAQRDGELTTVMQAGEVITGDPREQDLAVSVDEMVELVQDERLRVRTSKETVEAGEKVTDWDGGLE